MIGNVRVPVKQHILTSVGNCVTLAHQNDTNLSINGCVNTNSSVIYISQNRLRSQNIATNTNTNTNSKNNANSNATSKAAAKLGGNGKEDNKNDESKRGSEDDNAQIDDSKEVTKKEESPDSGADVLPCAVYTFRFDRNDMFAFIKNKDMIAESVAECLERSVNIVGKILQCVLQGYEIELSEYNLDSMIKICDIQSQEAGDLIFEFLMPKVLKKQDALSKIVQFDEGNE